LQPTAAMETAIASHTQCNPRKRSTDGGRLTMKLEPRFSTL
jgi:hypothetical protein